MNLLEWNHQMPNLSPSLVTPTAVAMVVDRYCHRLGFRFAHSFFRLVH